MRVGRLPEFQHGAGGNVQREKDSVVWDEDQLLREGEEAFRGRANAAKLDSERLVKRMRLAVSSSEPDQPLETAAEAVPKCPDPQYRDRGFGAIAGRGFETSVRGNLERVGSMQVRFPTRISLAVRRCFLGRSAGLLMNPRLSFKRGLVGVPVAMLLGVLLLSGVAQAQSAGSWNKKGQKAEARQDYDAAFEAFRQAHLKKPADLRYRTRYERMRFEAANMHVDRGRVLRQSGDVAGAVNEFARALQIDPGNQVAAQELQVTEKPSAAAGSPVGTVAAGVGEAQPPAGGASPGPVVVPGLGEQTPHQAEVKREIASMDGPVELQPVSDDPITLHMVEDTKVVYQAICKAAGLNVIFDPEYVPKRIPVDLNSVSLPDALHIVEVLSGTFWKPITTNTIFVAQNSRQKRTDLDDLAVQTFYLTNVSQQNDANEIMVAIRNLLDPGLKIYLVASQNALVIRATPDELVLAEKLINDLDRTRPEVVVDVAVLEVSRQLERNLGITLPTSFGLTPQYSNANVTTSSTGTTSTTTTGTSSTTSTSGITLNTLGNLNATNFAVSISGGTVNALLSDSDTRILQNPRIRATDGQHSTLKIGSKIPIATGSYSAGTAITTASLGVQTQFTYLDVGVNIDITPTVHYDREVSLKLKVEVSAQNGSVTISGVTEPIISQRVAEQVIQLKDGEPAILAGLLQQQDTANTNGTPGLGELPFLKYFFSSRDKTKQSDEIVFLIIPHIVRESILTDENTRAIYTGTSQAVELIRKDPSKGMADAGAGPGTNAAGPNTMGQPTSAANAANSMIGKMASDARPIAPGSVAMAASGAMSGSPTVTLTVVPAGPNQAVGSTFQVSVVASNAHDLFAAPLQMQFDPRVLALVNVDSGDLLSRDGQAAALVHRDEGNGAVTVSATRPPGAKGVDGQGTLCTLTFKALAPGDATLALTRVGLKDSHQNGIASVGGQAVVHVR
jgi:general secretion pathway protein D